MNRKAYNKNYRVRYTNSNNNFVITKCIQYIIML